MYGNLIQAVFIVSLEYSLPGLLTDFKFIFSKIDVQKLSVGISCIKSLYNINGI